MTKMKDISKGKNHEKVTEIMLPSPIPATTPTTITKRKKNKKRHERKKPVGICISVTFYSGSNLGAHKI